MLTSVRTLRLGDLPGGSVVQESTCQAGDVDSILGQKDLLEKEMATHSCILAWKIPWTEEHNRLQFMQLQNSQTRLSN